MENSTYSSSQACEAISPKLLGMLVTRSDAALELRHAVWLTFG
jgi:hypothetical protein